MMQPEVYFGEYYSVETTCGTEIIPVDVSGNVHWESDLEDYLEGKPLGKRQTPSRQAGFLARLSMPGCLDCTDWTAHESEQAALDYLEEMYGLADG